MSKVMRAVVNNAMLTKTTPLSIVVFTGDQEFDNNLVNGSRHSFFTLCQNKIGIYTYKNNELLTNFSIVPNIVIDTDPINNINDSSLVASNIRVPLLLVFHSRLHMPNFSKVQIGQQLKDHDIVTTDPSITDEYYLYNTLVNTTNWDDFINEFLYMRY